MIEFKVLTDVDILTGLTIKSTKTLRKYEYKFEYCF